MVRTYLSNSLCIILIVIVLLLGRDISVRAHNFWGSGCTPDLDIISQKQWPCASEMISIFNSKSISFGNMSLTVGPLCIGLFNTWLTCRDFRHG